MFTELHQLPGKENNKWRFDVRKRSVLILKTTRAAGARRRLRLLLKLSTSPHGRDTQILRGEEHGDPGGRLRSDATWKCRRAAHTTGTNRFKEIEDGTVEGAEGRRCLYSCLFRKQRQMWASCPPRG